MKITFILFAFLLSIPAARSQQPTQMEQEFSIEFRALSWTNTLRDLFYRDGDEETQLFIPDRGLSRVYKYTGPSPLRIFRNDPLPDGSEQETQVAVVPLRPEESSYIVLMFQAPGEEGSVLKALPIADSGFRSEEDQVVVFNFTQSDLAGDFGGARFRLPSLGFRAVPARKDERGSLRAQLATEVDGDLQPVYSTTWTLRDGLQLFVFVSSGESNDKTVKVKRISVLPEESISFDGMNN